jgi:hypothetical protein
MPAGTAVRKARAARWHLAGDHWHRKGLEALTSRCAAARSWRTRNSARQPAGAREGIGIVHTPVKQGPGRSVLLSSPDAYVKAPAIRYPRPQCVACSRRVCATHSCERRARTSAAVAPLAACACLEAYRLFADRERAQRAELEALLFRARGSRLLSVAFLTSRVVKRRPTGSDLVAPCVMRR